ncbi:MAG: zinc ribbon domain-containing protein [Nitrospirota bacterium]
MKEKLDKFDAYQLMALSVLANIIGRITYESKRVKDDYSGAEYKVPGFSNVAALKLSDELLQSARQRGLEEKETRRFENKLADWDDLIGSLNPWTEEIPDSALDAYSWEVEEPNDQMPNRSKRRVKKEFFETDWIKNYVYGDTTPNRCSICGERVDGNPKFCPHCGNALNFGTRCSGCGNTIVGNPKFCPNCGKQQNAPAKCSGCGQSIEEGQKFCPNCGQSVKR